MVASSGKSRLLSLDARITSADIANKERRDIVSGWVQKASIHLQLSPAIATAMTGIVMEIRQGYKSKDSKRQNADIANAAEAYTKGFVPVLLLFSTQIDDDVVERYQRGKSLVLMGTTVGDDLTSTYHFVRDIIGYDLAAFFQRNSLQLKTFTLEVLENLLRADNDL